jgi:hypothetical protein
LLFFLRNSEKNSGHFAVISIAEPLRGRISGAHEISIADKFMEEQQKQRGRRCAE